MSADLNNRERAKQIISFEGMKRRGNLAPTDIDGFQEYNGRLFIFIEGKVIGNKSPIGQETSFKSMCDVFYYANSLSMKYENKHSNRVAFVLIFEHNTPVENDVVMKDQYVVDTYNSISLAWKKPTDIDVIPKFKTKNGKITVLDAIIQIENWCYEHKIPIGE